MSARQVIYLVLAVLGFAAVVAVPLSIYGSGSTVLPVWKTAVNPGPLSKAHAFLETECGACHTSNRGVMAVACLTCHASDAPVLAKQPTAFHMDIQECRGCHIEHRGRMTRPIAMNHEVLARIGWGKLEEPAAVGSAMSEIAHFLARTTGGHQKDDIAALDCQSCHSNRDPHRGLFGRECAECHKTENWKIAGFLHPSPRSQDCVQCHQAPPSHYMMHFEMVSMRVAGQEHARVEQCFLCHQTDSWNDIKGVGWFKHH